MAISQSTILNAQASNSICWKSVLAGTIFALATAWIMYLFGGALGISLINPYAQDPTGGLGYGAGAWIFITWLVSLFLGGLVAGRVSDGADHTSGMIHGTVVWSVCIVLTISLGVMGVSNFLQAGGDLIKSSAAAGAMYVVSDTKSADNTLDTTPKGLNTLALESDIKQQISQSSAISSQGQQIVNPNDIKKSVTQLNSIQLIQVASYLLQGDTDAAKNVIAINTDLSTDDINRIFNNLNEKVQQYKQNIKAYTDKAANYTAAVLWIVLISNLASLLAAMVGGVVGMNIASRAYGRKLN